MTLDGVGTLVSPIEGLKHLECRVRHRQTGRRNACKPDRGIETTARPCTTGSGRAVGTLVSPIEGLKHRRRSSNAQGVARRNACKPDRGIETPALQRRAIQETRRNACKPDRGIETYNQSSRSLEIIGVGTLVSPIEGLKPLITGVTGQDGSVGTLVSPIEGLKQVLADLAKTRQECRNACKPDRGIETFCCHSNGIGFTRSERL